MARKSEAIRKMEKLFKDVTSAKEMRRLGRMTVVLIKDRTRNEGMGVPSRGGRPKKLKAVGDAWAKRRIKLRRHPRAAKGNESNLTQTGKLLNQLKTLKARRGILFIGWKDELNNKKAEGQEKMGRVFLDLAATEIDILKDSFEKRISELARRV